MLQNRLTRRALLSSLAAGGAGLALAACQPKIVQVTTIVEKQVEKVVKETVVVEETKVVEKQVEKVVKETVVVKETAPVVVLRYSYWAFNVEKNGLLQHAFMDEFPQIRIKEEVTGWGQYWQKILTATAAGDTPDVMTHSPYYHVQFAANKVTMPLDPFIDRDKIDLSAFYKPAIDQGRWQKGRTRTGQGDLHVFPEVWHTGTTFFYNKKLFDDAKIPYPAADPNKRIDWNDLLSLATQLTKVDSKGNFTQAGMNTPMNGNGWITNWIFSAGGDLFDAEETKCTIKSDPAMESFNYCVDMVRKQKVALPPDPSAQVEPFQTSKVAMSLSGDWWIIPWADIKDFGWDIFPSPKHPKTGKSVVDAYQNGISICTPTKHKEEAWTFVKWKDMGPGIVKTLEINGSGFPAHIATAEKMVYVKSRTATPVSLWLLGEDLKTALPVFNGANVGEVAQIVYEEQQGAFTGAKTVMQAADDMEKRVNASLEKAVADILSK